MALLYDELKRKYNLTGSYPVLSFEDEKKKIKLYQNPKTPDYIKKDILNFFWEANKQRIIKQAISLYSFLNKKYKGEINFEIEDLIHKGFMAIPHCLDIYHVVKKQKPSETKKQFEERSAKVKGTRFGTLLQWWIRPYILERINQENFIIYVPHSKTSDKKSITIASMDAQAFRNSPKTQASLIADNNPENSPEKITEKTMFWENVKEALDADEYEFIYNWMNLGNKFSNKQEFAKHYNMTSAQIKSKINKISKKLKPALKDWNI